MAKKNLCFKIAGALNRKGKISTKLVGVYVRVYIIIRIFNCSFVKPLYTNKLIKKKQHFLAKSCLFRI